MGPERPGGDAPLMLDEPPPTTGELLEQWREATRAAELAERLANLARTSVERSDRDSIAAQEIAKVAERAARHAERAAKIAREAAESPELLKEAPHRRPVRRLDEVRAAKQPVLRYLFDEHPALVS